MNDSVDVIDIDVLLLNEQNYLKSYIINNFKLSYDDINDLIQEVNIKVLLNKDKYNHKQKFRAWLTTICYNCFINNFRLNKRRNENRIDCDPFQLDDCKLTTNSADSDIIYQQAFDKIKSDRDYLLILGINSGYSYCQLADIFDVPIGTIKSKIFQAKHRIRKIL